MVGLDAVGKLWVMMLSSAACWCCVSPVYGEDWPGLLGPRRDGHSLGAVLAVTANQEAPSVRWVLDAGEGYAGAAIFDGHTFLLDRLGDQERLRKVALATGQVQWTQVWPAAYRGGIDADKGPRCVPMIAGDRVVCYSAAGDLLAISQADGSLLWSRGLRRDYQADDGYFGAGSTPLVLGDRIIVNVGGRRGGIVAIQWSDGKELWRATTYDASYASPIAWSPSLDQAATASAAIEETVIVVPTRLKTVALAAASGDVLWEVDFGQRGPTVNAATPLVRDRLLFLTASYGIGSLSLELPDSSSSVSNPPLRSIYQGEALSSQYATPVIVDKWVFGSEGREDLGNASYRCLDPRTGEVAWEEAGLPICHTIAIADQQLLLVGIDGSLRLVEANPVAFRKYWEKSLAAGTYRALPALADRQLVLRSNGPEKQWLCVDLSQP
jgi:outer membrane protein assembly factor BamB